ncbi:YaiO family outer membrane beta-barrel protein [Gillisia sp. M10.2A]|uniref:YaiO family outer membrane beta-barrel protein n=1 Tax=Gillisia lutea TaxID=2909668 RepID=A0ABS9EHD2_9FLAO|nr:YaiO family outer membrane beta-barrel protein [Gillisia lutea]MCF4101160.1 YaiO family outer membrane beta-barrel protein [Gillisia lutea]
MIRSLTNVMGAKNTNLFVITVLLLFFSVHSTHAQEDLSSDELFTKARAAAFDEDNYPKAIDLSKQALQISPNYADIRIFLGRLYTWTDKVDSARVEFDRVLEIDPGHEDGSLAYGSLEYWNDNSERAHQIVNEGIKYHPESEELLYLDAKILNDLKKYDEATNVLNTLLAVNPNHADARAYREKIKNVSSKNQVGVSYDFVYFDKRFDDPWHLASVDYGRQTKFGSISARFNYANRFTTNGAQFELDAYPRISDVFYAYVSGGIAEKDGIFPRYRAGFSLYANLPLAFEGEAGFRMLSFDDETWIYTASVGKYYKNYWFNLRTYLTPSNNAVSQSFSLNVRYYLAGADDFLSFGIGTGLSPDNEANNILYNNGDTYKLKSNNISIGYRKSINLTNILIFSAGLENQEYAQGTKGNQVTVSVGYNKRF